MSVGWGLKVITNNLVCCYDGFSRKCYPGNGSTVLDLSNNRNNITNMVPGLYSAASGLFVFTGNLGNLNTFNESGVMPNAYTIQIVIQAPKGISGVSNAMGIFGRTVFPISGIGFGMGQSINQYTFFGYTPSGNHPSNTIGPINYNKPDILTFTYQDYTGQGYLNGTLQYTLTGGYAPVNNTMLLGGHGQGGWSNMSGLIYSFYVYNRGLTQSEVRSNYYAVASRYGLI